MGVRNLAMRLHGHTRRNLEFLPSFSPATSPVVAAFPIISTIHKRFLRMMLVRDHPSLVYYCCKVPDAVTLEGVSTSKAKSSHHHEKP